jgi:uncharacterized iron-regulated membrane protein
MNRWSRRLHRWGGLTAAIPILLVVLTGLMLQFKKEITWIQPKTHSADHAELAISWDSMIRTAQSIPEAAVSDWKDIDRLDVRPSKGIIKIRCKNNWELQIDSVTGDVLSSAYRRSDVIESLHDGSFFSDFTKLYVFSANGFVLLGLWITGMWLWYLPVNARRKKKKRIAAGKNAEMQSP